MCTSTSIIWVGAANHRSIKLQDVVDFRLLLSMPSQSCMYRRFRFLQSSYIMDMGICLVTGPSGYQNEPAEPITTAMYHGLTQSSSES